MNLLIIGPSREFLRSVSGWVSRTGLVERVFTATDAAAALKLASTGAPELIVLDAGLPNSDWLSLSTELKRRSPMAKVLLLSGAGPADVKGKHRHGDIDGHLSRNDFARQFRRLLHHQARG